MPHVLHLLKDTMPPAALAVIRAQARDPAVRLSVVLLPGAADPAAALPGDVYRLALPGAPAPASPSIDPDGLLHLVFEADSVVAW